MINRHHDLVRYDVGCLLHRRKRKDAIILSYSSLFLRLMVVIAEDKWSCCKAIIAHYNATREDAFQSTPKQFAKKISFLCKSHNQYDTVHGATGRIRLSAEINEGPRWKLKALVAKYQELLSDCSRPRGPLLRRSPHKSSWQPSVLLTARINHHAHFLLSPRQRLVISSNIVPLPREQSGVPKSIRLDISVG